MDQDYIAAHTEDYESFARHVESFDLERTSRATGIAVEELESLARTLGDRDKRVSYWWTMGVNQGYEAVRTAQAIINLALMTGNLGKPGTGANSISGQCNAMGSRLFSNTTCLFGGRRFDSEEDRRFIAGTLGIPEARIPQQESWAYDQIVQGIHDGKIKALWVVATNGLHSWIEQNGFNEALEKLDFLVVQDLYHSTETARRADLLLPAAGWAEKDGTFINSERRIGLVKKVRRAPGQALADFSIVRLLAQRWGCGDWFREWSSPEAVFQLLKQTTRGQPCDITGIRDYRMLDEAGGIQWPLPDATEPKRDAEERDAHGSGDQISAYPDRERRLFEDGRFYTQSGRARFCYADVQVAPEPVDDSYPLRLLTGRGSSSQWHTESRTAKSAVLRKLRPDGLHLEIHPEDAERLGVEPGGRVRVASRRGQLEARAFVTPTVQPGQVFLPMHSGATNRLTKAVFDPHSRRPSYKDCAVRVEPLAS